MSQEHQAQSTPKLHPVLQGAMRSLDVNLESELKRYRRQKAGELLQRGLTVSSQNGKSSETISTMAGLPALQNRWLLRTLLKGDRAPDMPLARLEGNHRNTEQLASGVVEAQGGDASLALISAVGSTGDKGGSTSYAAISQTAPDKEVAIAQLEKEPDDYLESSEELLKSLASPADTESCRKSNLLTPLGIGSILLLLMVSGTLWFAGKNPSLVGHLKGEPPVVESNPKQANTDISPTAAVDLNLDSLSRLPTGARYSPQQVSSPAVKERSPEVEPIVPVNSPATPLSVVEIPTVVPIPRTPTQLDSWTDASELSTRTDAAFAQSYYVVASDLGEDSLEQIGKIIPEATVREFPQGRKIQLGVFQEESRALSLVEKLADRGISAQIYKHRY